MAGAVTISAGQVSNGIDFQLDPTGIIRGRVTDSSGNPLANIPISLDGPGFGSGTCTNSNGEYQVGAAYGVEWRVRAFPVGDNWCGGSTAYAQQFWPNQFFWENAGTITLTTGQPERNDIDFTLQPGGGISGRVFQSNGTTPISGICINVSATAINPNGVTGWGETDADGNFTIWGFPVGTVYIRAEPNCNGHDNPYISEWYAAGASTTDPALAGPVALSAGQLASGINFQLDQGGSISGRIVQQDGVTPISGAQINIDNSQHQGIKNTVSNPDGTYRAAGLSTGSYYVSVVADGFGGVYYGGYDDVTAELVNVVLPDETSGINFQLSPEATISGHIYESDGITPVAGVEVRAWPYRGGMTPWTTSAADGSYTIRGLASGEFVVMAQGAALGFEDEYYENQFSWNSSNPVLVTQPDNTPGINFTLSHPGLPPESERLALVNFYNSLGGSSWNSQTGWLTDPNACQWNGISCHDGHVVGILFYGNGLSGNLPTQWAGLPELRQLLLFFDPISGVIPTGISSLTKLRLLGIGMANLSGSIPPEITGMTSLSHLYLYGNALTGSIPANIGDLSNLRWLFLSNNQLSGDVPESLVQLTGLCDQPHLSGTCLAIDYNKLNVPDPYPATPPTALQEFLALKNPDWYLTQSAQVEIPDGGGTLTSQDDQTTITFPPNTVSELTTFEFVPLPGSQNATGNLRSAFSNFELHALDSNGVPIPDFTFAQPVTVTLNYTDQDIAGIEESTLALYYWDDSSSAWVDAADSCSPGSSYVREPDQNRLSVDICHLSEFDLLGIRSTEIRKVYLPAIRR